MTLGGMKNCNSCGKVFVGNGPICSDCIKLEEKTFEDVHRFLRDNPNSTTKDIAAALDVDEELIIKFLKQGRIQTSDQESASGSCSKCGATIERGTYCMKCILSMKEQISGASNTLEGNIGGPIKNAVHSQGLNI